MYSASTNIDSNPFPFYFDGSDMVIILVIILCLFFLVIDFTIRQIDKDDYEPIDFTDEEMSLREFNKKKRK